MERQLHFSVDSSFIQSLAQEKLVQGNDPVSAWRVLEVLTPAGSEIDPAKLFYTKYQILDGQIRLQGTYPEESIQMLPTGKSGLVEKQIQKMTDRLTEIEEQQEHAMEILDKVMELVPDTYLRAVNEALDEKVFPVDETNEIIGKLHDFMQSDFGWLAPDGTWNEVDFGGHESWAQEYLREHDMFTDEVAYANNATDYLISKLNFCLVHNPDISEPQLQCNRLTNRQKEFLYDYFLKLDMPDRANGLYAEDDA